MPSKEVPLCAGLAYIAIGSTAVSPAVAETTIHASLRPCGYELCFGWLDPAGHNGTVVCGHGRRGRCEDVFTSRAASCARPHERLLEQLSYGCVPTSLIKYITLLLHQSESGN